MFSTSLDPLERGHRPFGPAVFVTRDVSVLVLVPDGEQKSPAPLPTDRPAASLRKMDFPVVDCLGEGEDHLACSAICHPDPFRPDLAFGDPVEIVPDEAAIRQCP